MRARKLALLVVAGFACLGSGCVTVPSLEHNNIPISDVVERIKCDLADAVPDAYRYPWMANWVAKVDLTLIVNEQSGITPTASLIDLRPSAFVPGVGNIAQSFIFGAGFGATSTAVRTDSLSFSLSLVELRYKHQEQRCVAARGIGLDGELGLKEWIASALDPVDRGVLTVGYHPRLMSTRSAAKPKRPPPPPPGNDPPIDFHLASNPVRRCPERQRVAELDPGKVPWADPVRQLRAGLARSHPYAGHRHGLAARRPHQHQRVRHGVR